MMNTATTTMIATTTNFVRCFAVIACLVLVIAAPCLAYKTGSGEFAQGLAAYGAAAEAPGYAAASAHKPAFDNKAIWPKLSGKEFYLASKWPAAKMLIWAKPGQSGRFGQRGELDPTQPENWIDAATGKPPAQVVLDENTDLHFPAAEKVYSVGFRHSPIREVCRHLTVENNAAFIGGGDGVGRQIYGNVWVKRGGKIYAQGSTTLQGAEHTFFRNDNDTGDRTMCSQYFTFNTPASVEYLGHVSVLDEFRLKSGTVIVAPDSILQPGRSAEPSIAASTTLVLLDGAYFGKWTNEFHRAVDLNCSGTLQGGLPDRPLTRSAGVGLSFRNWQKTDFSTWSNDPKKGIAQIRLVSGIFRTGSTIRSYSASPDATLVITWTGVERTNAVGDPMGADDKALSMFTNKEFAAAFNAIPRKITVFFEDQVTVDGVRFDNVHPGGILMKAPESRSAWKRVSYGPGNSIQGDGLFQQMTIDRGGRW